MEEGREKNKGKGEGGSNLSCNGLTKQLACKIKWQGTCGFKALSPCKEMFLDI